MQQCPALLTPIADLAILTPGGCAVALLNTRIQAVIKEQCTAIHPAVEWRFRQAAMHWGERRQRGTPVEMQLNETLAAYLEGEEDKAQAMIPHYFEQHKSDGIEFGIYVGASLLEHGGFDRMHVHNLRLWQLLAMCGLAQQAAHVKAALKVPLEVAHLILVQDTPLAIRFRFDEKRFDIDGAYNMHYEIVKKRIDKALIKDTYERLTQPGKIAIVYTQPREALEYRGYIAYLHATGALTDEVETLALEELQGAQGLQALRVTVALPPLSLLRPEETVESVPQPRR